jgi:cytochrome P450
MTRAECEGETMLAILAGNDTSAATIRATLLHLMLTPHAYSQFKSEIKHAVERGEVSSPITNDESLKLPYTQVRFKF